MIEQHPELIAFRIIHSKEKPSRKKQPISEFHVLESQLAHFGLLDIRLIVFYFNTQRYHYPYGIHPIILERTNNSFDVVFYHYYNPSNIHVGINTIQKECDYHALIHFLRKQKSMLLSYIETPFIT